MNSTLSEAVAPDSRDRRKWLGYSMAVPAAVAMAGKIPAAHADAHSAKQPNAIKHSFALGDFDVSTLLAGTRSAEDPQSIFGMNVSSEEFEQVSQENFIPADRNQFFFTPTVVRAGDEVVLFDTGLNAEGITAALAAAGYSPEEITTVVLTHMHGDHIGGLTTEDGQLTFANAGYVAGQVEYDAWAKQDNDNFKTKVEPLREKIRFIGDGDAVVSGISGMAAHGHTPGHMMYRLESGGQQLALIADTANHYVWSLAYPEWEVKFDMDKSKAASTRKAVFDMLSADRIPFVGYHMPFPGLGYVDTRGEGGYHYVPVSYQLMG